jgi:hypothetical protein
VLRANNSPEAESAAQAPSALTWLSAGFGLGTVIALAAWLGASAPAIRGMVDVRGGLRPARVPACVMAEDGFLSGRLYGEIDRQIDWSGRNLKCDGMLRPAGDGMRLVFQPVDDRASLLFVLGIDGSPEAPPGGELPVNLTIVDEANDRFYNSGEERCWATIERVRVFGEAGQPSYFITGAFYCAGALPALNGTGSITPGDFRFAGRLRPEDA